MLKNLLCTEMLILFHSKVIYSLNNMEKNGHSFAFSPGLAARSSASQKCVDQSPDPVEKDRVVHHRYPAQKSGQTAEARQGP